MAATPHVFLSEAVPSSSMAKARRVPSNRRPSGRGIILRRNLMNTLPADDLASKKGIMPDLGFADADPTSDRHEIDHARSGSTAEAALLWNIVAHAAPTAGAQRKPRVAVDQSLARTHIRGRMNMVTLFWGAIDLETGQTRILSKGRCRVLTGG